MSNAEDTAAVEERSEHEVLEPLPKLRKWISVDIKLADNHYLAKFNHGSPRVFHNIQQLLTAIEVECDKLGPGPTQT